MRTPAGMTRIILVSLSFILLLSGFTLTSSFHRMEKRLIRQRNTFYSNYYLQKGERYLLEGKEDLAKKELQKALEYNRGNESAKRQLDSLDISSKPNRPKFRPKFAFR